MKNKKLQLNKETIAQLNDTENKKIIGGMQPACTYWDDWSCRIKPLTEQGCPPADKKSAAFVCTNYTEGGDCFSQGVTYCGNCG